MLLIDRAWKANVNVWKRHLTLQLVFNHGESMVHVDKNVDGHVLDQNVDRILRKIAYVPLSGRIRSKRSSYSPFFFLFWKKKWVQDMLTNGHDKIRISVVILNFGHAFQRSDGFEVLDMLPKDPMVWNLDILLEVRWNWILDVLPRGMMELDFGRASQRFNGLILDMLPRGPMVWSLDVLPEVW